MQLKEIVKDYVATYRERAQRELRYYAIQRSLPDAIREAALSRLPGGKRHPHQRRIPGRVLETAERALQRELERLGNASSFLDLHASVADIIGAVHGIGTLAIYDIAHRVGAFLKLEPELVYLHAGAREGARALGIYGHAVDRSQFPRDFRHLSPAELEDCLCIYKDALRAKRWPNHSCYN